MGSLIRRLSGLGAWQHRSCLPVLRKSSPIIKRIARLRLLCLGIERDVSKSAHAAKGSPVGRRWNHVAPGAGIDVKAIPRPVALDQTHLWGVSMSRKYDANFVSAHEFLAHRRELWLIGLSAHHETRDLSRSLARRVVSPSTHLQQCSRQFQLRRGPRLGAARKPITKEFVVMDLSDQILHHRNQFLPG